MEHSTAKRTKLWILRWMGEIATFLLTVAAITSCGSTQMKLPEVPPQALLSEDCLVYVGIPVKLQKELTVRLIHSFMPSVSEKTIESLAVRCDRLYAGIANSDDSKRLEVSVKGDFPPLTIGAGLSEKNGWQREFRTYDSGGLLPFATAIYSSEQTGEVALAFPSSSIMCASRAIDAMMTRYAPRPETYSGDAASWIGDSAGGMRFYILRPARAIPALQGSPMESLVEAVYGSVEGNGDEVTLDFYLKLCPMDGSKANLTANALVTLLRISMAKAGVQINKTDDGAIKVAGMKMQATALALFLGTD